MISLETRSPRGRGEKGWKWTLNYMMLSSELLESPTPLGPGHRDEQLDTDTTRVTHSKVLGTWVRSEVHTQFTYTGCAGRVTLHFPMLMCMKVGKYFPPTLYTSHIALHIDDMQACQRILFMKARVMRGGKVERCKEGYKSIERERERAETKRVRQSSGILRESFKTEII